MDQEMRIRKSSRAIVLNKKNEIFLFQYMFDYLEDCKAIWITPGGGLEEGESVEDALKRELFEELGVQIKEKCPEVYYRNPVYTLKNGEKVQSVEKFFLVILEDEEFSSERRTESEKKRMLAGKWWSAEEIERSEEAFFSKDVLRILHELSNGNYSDVPLEIA